MQVILLTQTYEEKLKPWIDENNINAIVTKQYYFTVVEISEEDLALLLLTYVNFSYIDLTRFLYWNI